MPEFLEADILQLLIAWQWPENDLVSFKIPVG